VGRVVAKSARAIVVADTGNPAGGFTDADYRGIAATFDTLVYPVDVRHFGEPTDLDNNGRSIIFYTRAVNELTPANVQARLVELLPDIAGKLPQPKELRSVSINGSGAAQDGQGVATLVAQMLALTNILKAEGAGKPQAQQPEPR